MDRKKILVLGAGLVAQPLVRYLLDHDFSVTVADRFISKAETVINGHPQGRAIAWTNDQLEALRELVSSHDLTVSLLPAPHHPTVGEACIAVGKSMVTASYVSPEMRALDEAAKKAGVILINEVGVDPGIDHMSIMRVLDAVRSKGGQLTTLTSCCGGLPAPESNTNPLGYKFSWSPAGVLVAMTGPSRFLENGKKIEEPAGGLFDHVHRTTVDGLGELEYYPNRDSLGYIDIYSLSGIKTMFRGTFRYPGWIHLWKALSKVGFLDRSARTDLSGRTWAEVMAELVEGTVGPELRAQVASYTGVATDDRAMDQADWLGLFGETKVSDDGNLLDCIAALLLEKMTYAEGERDMLIMKHEFDAVYPDGKTEHITSTMLDFGIPGGDSSMARTVSLPAAIAARMVLEGKIAAKGVQIPVIPEIYNPVLDELAELGITLDEKWS